MWRYYLKHYGLINRPSLYWGAFGRSEIWREYVEDHDIDMVTYEVTFNIDFASFGWR